MAARRSRGDGAIYWKASRKRWIAEITVGYDGRGKRLTRSASALTKTEAKDKLKKLQHDYDDGLLAPAGNYTIGDAADARLHRGIAADRCAHRGNARLALVRC